ncbi:amidohydrolase [Rothia aeria]|uniref:amidohydrolase n=1 Tax=Rothia aeria TaxID=172042 RepID=UPI0024202BB9|nr:amidohydrolase [Rothia aeria]
MTIRVLLNGSIYTPADPYATAILTEHGTVRWAGSDAGARSITDNTMETIDLNGRLVTPTFTRALAPVTGKTTAEILTYLTTAHHAGYHTHTLTTDPNTLQPLIEAAQQFTSTHTTADLRILLTNTPPHALTETITHTRETLNGTPLTLAGLHANTPTEAQHLADTAAQTQLTLCINAHPHLTQAAATAQTIRRTHPHLTLRLDTIKTTPEETLNDQELQALANSRISLGLQATAENADLARRANTIGTPISIGSDPTLDAPLGWQAVKIFATAPHGISARSAFAALTRSPHRALADANPFAGQLAPDTPANLAIWNVTELMVQAPDSRVASWSTDPRARIPLLPALDVPLPTLERLYTQEQ